MGFGAALVLSICVLTSAASAQSSSWQRLDRIGDCPGHDVGSTNGATPDNARAREGYTAVCWDVRNYENKVEPGRIFCTYKNVEPGACTGGISPGVMYRGVADTTRSSNRPPSCDDFCRAFNTVLEARANGYRSIAGDFAFTQGNYTYLRATVTLPGGYDCTVSQQKRNYNCVFVRGTDKAQAGRIYRELVSKVRRSLPAGLSLIEEPDSASENAYVRDSQRRDVVWVNSIGGSVDIFIYHP